MPCSLCVNKQKINPSASFITSDSHVFIPIKNSRVYHLIHLNKDKYSSVYTGQPKHVNSLNESIKINDLIEKSSPNIEKIIADTDLNYTFKVINKTDSSGYSLIYRNKIQLDQTTSEAKTQKPLLFFIHGVGGNVKVWFKQLEYFSSQNYEIIAIDLLGHGQTCSTNELSNYEFEEMASDALLIFDMFAKADNVIIGHSYGCSFATYLSQCRQDIVSKLILISGGSPHPLDFKSPILSLPLCVIRLFSPIINCHFFCKAFHSCCNKPEHSEEAFNITTKNLFYTMKGQVWRAATEQYHRKLKQPVLLIEGEKDQLVPLEDALDMIDIIKYGYLAVLKNGSHMIIIEQHELINNLISLFLNDDFK